MGIYRMRGPVDPIRRRMRGTTCCRPYANMLPYGQVYTGAVVTGPLYGYANNCIWYCPKQIVAGAKNASSGKNSFHYAMNDVPSRKNGSSGFKGR